jgi:hypothetical protein
MFTLKSEGKCGFFQAYSIHYTGSVPGAITQLVTSNPFDACSMPLLLTISYFFRLLNSKILVLDAFSGFFFFLKNIQLGLFKAFFLAYPLHDFSSLPFLLYFPSIFDFLSLFALF